MTQDSLAVDTIALLEEITVSYQANRSTPMTFQNIQGSDLKLRSTGQEPSFLLSELPSITVYSDAGSTQGYSYFRLRGIDQTRINMTLDGVPLNEPEDQGAYFSNYPDILNSVRKIQVQRGVGTTQNGVASYGGSIQLFSPSLFDEARTTLGINYGSFNSVRAFGEYKSRIRNNKALYARASQIYSGGYKYDASNLSQSVFLSAGSFAGKSAWKLNLLAGHQQNELAWLGVSDSLIAIDPRTNANENERDAFTQCLAQLQNTWQPGSKSALRSSVYYTFLDGDYDFNLNNFLGLPSTEELYNYAFRSHLLGFFSNYTYSANRLNWTTGIHANLYQRQHTGSEQTLGQLYTNTGFKNEISAFTKADYTRGSFSVFADVQVRYTSFQYQGAVPLEPLDWSFINPKLGLSYSPGTNSTFYYSLGKTGREPTRNDLFGGNDDLLADTLGRALLFIQKPEYVTDHELGVRHQSSSFSLNLNLYYMDFENEIVLDGKFGPNGLALTNNVEQSYRTGIELSASLRLSRRLSLVHHSSLNHSRIREQEVVFTPILTPAVTVFQEMAYENRNFGLALSGRYQSRSYIDFANTETLEGYILLNARAHYERKRFRYSLFLNNLTNARYFNNGYVDFDGTTKYFVQAPIHFHAAVQYSW